MRTGEVTLDAPDYGDVHIGFRVATP